MNPLGAGEERGRRSGGAWKEGVAPTASLNGMRRSEKGPRTSEHTFTHKHTHIMHNITRFRLAYPLRCRGY